MKTQSEFCNPEELMYESMEFVNENTGIINNEVIYDEEGNEVGRELEVLTSEGFCKLKYDSENDEVFIVSEPVILMAGHSMRNYNFLNN